VCMFAAIYSDKRCAAAVSSAALTEPVGAVESQLLSS
jgi:hypothetical protein